MSKIRSLKKECKKGMRGWAVIPVTGSCALANAAGIARRGLVAPVTICGAITRKGDGGHRNW